jgi:glucose-1-phosphate thymidylyltransferase
MECPPTEEILIFKGGGYGMLKENIVGVIPAAGEATRLWPLPGSKELFPIGFAEKSINGEPRRHPKVVSQYLVDNMIQAGVEKIYLILSQGKLDIMRYYGDGRRFDAPIAYLMVEQMWGMPYSINQAYPWIKDATVVFGMPDTIFTPQDALFQVLNEHNRLKADLTLGLYRTVQPWRFGMVEFDDADRVIGFIDKPKQTNLTYMWGHACWGPGFTELMNAQLRSVYEGGKAEIVLSSFFQDALEKKLKISFIRFDDGEYMDIGTPNELEMAISRFSIPNLDKDHLP